MATEMRLESSSPATGGEELLLVEAITKTFPGVVALRDVDFSLRSREVHMVFGENGAGKSTLANIIAGTYHPDKGVLKLRGETLRHRSPHHARNVGINAVFQDFSLVPELTVEDNLHLGRETRFLRKATRARQARETLERLGHPLNPEAIVATLSRADRQMVEIAKALQGDPSIVIFDEPTASLTEKETARLFEIVDELKEQGVGIVYITHRVREIERVGTRITVLRDGQRVATLPADGVSEERLVQLMAGRPLEALYPRAEHRPGSVCLRLRNVSSANDKVRDVSIEVRSGEIVALAGLIGEGKSDVGRVCAGLHHMTHGEIEVDGYRLTRLSPKRALDAGIFYLTSDRHAEGLVLERSVRENLSLPSLDTPLLSRLGIVRRRHEARRARELATRLSLRPPRLDRPVWTFSGGNQQKILIGRAFFRDISLYIFDEPTVGIDIAARADVYGLMKELCENGGAILLISSDLSEVIHVTHRVYVIHGGRVQAELTESELTEKNILANFFDRREK